MDAGWDHISGSDASSVRRCHVDLVAESAEYWGQETKAADSQKCSKSINNL